MWKFKIIFRYVFYLFHATFIIYYNFEFQSQRVRTGYLLKEKGNSVVVRRQKVTGLTINNEKFKDGSSLSWDICVHK